MLVALFDAARSRTERYVVVASHEERKRWSSLESREPELNQAMVDVSREDFLVGNFDLKSLLSLSIGGFYSDDCVLWIGTEEMVGKTAAVQRMASMVEPIYTLFEMGMAFVESFRSTANSQDSLGNLMPDWEAVLGRTQLPCITFRWRT